jgi:hypothetical protein
MEAERSEAVEDLGGTHREADRRRENASRAFPAEGQGEAAAKPTTSVCIFVDMPDSDLVEQVIDVSFQLISASRTGEIGGDDVAREIGRSENDLYWAFQEARRRGALEMYFPGGMGLPSLIRLP